MKQRLHTYMMRLVEQLALLVKLLADVSKYLLKTIHVWKEPIKADQHRAVDFWQTAMFFLRSNWITRSRSRRLMMGFIPFVFTLLSFQTVHAQTCVLTLKPTVSGCYSVTGTSKATVSVEVAWSNITVSPTANDGSDAMTVTFAGQTKTIDPGSYTTTSGSGTIVSPQVVAFEVPADASTQTAQVFIGTGYTSAACKAQKTGIALPAACPPTVCTPGQLGGTVFNDFNANGVKDSGETTGLLGVQVKAYDCNNQLVSSTATDAFGKYVMTNIAQNVYPVRIEFSNLPAYAGQGTLSGTDGRTTVQFIQSPDCSVDLGILDSNDYCQTNPKLVIPCYVSGDPLVDGTATSSDAVVSFDYTASGLMDPAVMAHSVANQTGSLWGMAYNKFTKKIFSSATLKRHVGLGPLGLGGIYVADFSTVPANGSTFTYSNFIDVSTIGINVGTISSNSARGLIGDRTKPTHDDDAYLAACKVGIGGIDLSEDGNTLYLTNLFDNKLYAIDITAYNTSGTLPTAANVTSFDVKAGLPSNGGTLRIWAVKVHKGKVYTGLVNDAGISQNKSDLRAYVQQLNGTTVSTTFDFPLTYPKGYPVGGGTFSDYNSITGWYPWTDDWAVKLAPNYVRDFLIIHPEPIFSSIEFDIDGSMVMSFGDHTAIQGGHPNYEPLTTNTKLFATYLGGDILRAYSNGSSFVLENNAKAGPVVGYGPDNNQGPGFGEFYNDDLYNGSDLSHSENTVGGLALRPGSGEVINVAMDPIDVPAGANTALYLRAAGVRHISNQTGLTNSAFTIYNALTPGAQGKAAGLGDAVLLCSLPTYLEIGNRVWVDINKNGIQDACEKSLSGVLVSLYKGTTKIASTTTDTNGEYYFNNNPTSSTATNVASNTAIQPNTAYIVRFGTDGSTNQYDNTTGILTTSIGKFKLTQAFSTQPTANTMNDSNAQVISGFAAATVVTGAAGSVNHTIDAGFICAPTTVASVSIAKAACKGTAVNNDASINLTGIQCADKAFLVVAGGDIPSYSATGGQPVSASAVSFTGLANPTSTSGTSYSLVLYNGPCCYTVVTATLPQTVCAVKAALGDYVFEDVNANGVQDATDKPIAGVTVTLLSSGTVVATTTTNTSGLYSFTGLTPSVPYSVSFTTPAGFTATSQNTSTNDALDSDGNPATGLTGVYTLTANENNTTIDMGYYQPASLGDYVWVDANKNGIQDAGEQPIPGVVATLYVNGVASATTTTNASGLYSFTGLTPGSSLSYSVGFTKPANYTTTTVNAPGSTTANDSDVNPTTGRTQSVTLANGEDNLTLDAGFYLTPAIRVSLTSAPVCNTATNKYTATATVSLTSASAGTLTITDNGTTIGTLSVTANQATATISVTGLSNASSHTLIATLTGGISASTTYQAPASCTVCTVNLTTTNLPNGQVGTAYSRTLVTTGGTTPYAYTVSAGTLPAGLTLNPTTGVIAGTPTAPATSAFSIKVTDAKSCTDVASLTIVTSALPACSVDLAVTPGTCNSATNQYSISGTVTLANAVAGNLTISDGSSTTTVAVTASTTTVNFSLAGLVSGSGSHTVVASLAGCGSDNQVYTAPASCTVAPAPKVAVAVGTPVCNSATNNYTATGTVSLTNAVAGSLTITDNGTSLTTITVTAGQTTASFSVSGVSNASSHTVVATLTGGISASTTYQAPASCTVCTVNLTTTNLPNGQVGTAYSRTLVTTGGTTPYAYTVSAGTLPAGLTLNPTTGVIAGTPTAPATSAFSIKVTDAKSCTDVASLTIVTSALPACSVDLAVTPGTCNSATNQYSISGTVTLANAVAGNLTISDGSSTTTVAVTASTTTVNFTLAGFTSGSGSHTVIASLAGCGSDNQVYTAPASCTVAPCALNVAVTPGACNSATNQYSISGTVAFTSAVAGTMTITDGSSSTTVAVMAGSTSVSYSLAGLTSGSGSHTVVATLAGCGADNATYTAPASCTVCTVNLTTTNLPNAQVGTAYSRTLVTTGGTTPYAYTVSAGTLPAGLSLNPTTGVISGIPSTSATSVFSIKVTDAKSCTDVTSLTIVTSDQPVCSLMATATPGLCSTATNQYSVTGTVSATNTPATQSLTVSVGSRNTTVTLTGNGPVSYTLTGIISDGLVKTVSVVSSATACGATSMTYTAPVSCSIAPPTLSVLVSTPVCNTATNNYTATGTVSLTNAVAGTLTITDNGKSLTTITVTAGQTTASFSVSGVSNAASHTVIATLTGGTSASAIYSAPQSCTYICEPPVHVCKGTNYAIQLSAPTGEASYQWYRNGSAVAGATLSSFTATQAGSYSVVINNNVVGQCLNGSCCPVVIVEDSITTYQAQAQAPTCNTASTPTANSDGRILITNWKATPGDTTQYFYQVSVGSNFDATQLVAGGANSPVPANGILATNLANPINASGQAYTVRITSKLGCYKDVVVTLMQTNCSCPPAKCLPMVIRRTR